MCGKKLMQETTQGIYIGPRDSEDGQSDVFVKFNETHLTVYQFDGDRKLELSKNSASFLHDKQADITDAIRKGEVFTVSIQLDPSTSLRITTKEVMQEMVDIRVWYRNCVGRWSPSRKGARLHYIHVVNLITVIKEFLKL